MKRTRCSKLLKLSYHKIIVFLKKNLGDTSYINNFLFFRGMKRSSTRRNSRTIIYHHNLLKETLKYLQSSFSFFKFKLILYFLPPTFVTRIPTFILQPSSIIPLHKNRKRKRKDVSDDRRKRMGIKVGNETPCLKNTTN